MSSACLLCFPLTTDNTPSRYAILVQLVSLAHHCVLYVVPLESYLTRCFTHSQYSRQGLDLFQLQVIAKT